MFRLEEIACELRDVVATLDPAVHDGRDAARLTKVAAEGEKLFATAKVLLAKRAAETRGWVSGSSAASSDQWLAQISGCSEGAAREALAIADRVAELPATEAKLRDGSLSVGQASLVSRAATLDPAAEVKMLNVAGRGKFRNLRAEHERVVAAATDAEEAQRRAHRDRHLRTWTRGSRPRRVLRTHHRGPPTPGRARAPAQAGLRSGAGRGPARIAGRVPVRRPHRPGVWRARRDEARRAGGARARRHQRAAAGIRRTGRGV